jgi:hypothetical protein
MTENDSTAEKPTGEEVVSTQTKSENSVDETEPETIPAEYGAAASLDLDTVDFDEQQVSTRLLTAEANTPFGIQLTLDLGTLTTEVVLDAEATMALEQQLRDHVESLSEANDR